MVAIAILPPSVTFGLMIGSGNISLATGAGLLRAVNLVCVNLASKIVFTKGIRPRTWWGKKKATRAMIIYILVWIITLIILVFFVYSRQALTS